MTEMIAKENQFILNSVFFSGVLFVIFLLQSCKERERQQQLANKWARLNEQIKAAKAILAFRNFKKSHMPAISVALNIATDVRSGFQYDVSSCLQSFSGNNTLESISKTP